MEAEVTSQQAMDHAVQQAQAAVAAGVSPREPLEHLWRTAYAAGVRQASSRVYGNGFVPPWASGAHGPAMGGWRWGPLRDLRPGDVFVYGGTDPQRPVCERAAAVSRSSTGMELADTGERVRLPVMFWWRPKGAAHSAEDT